MSRSKKKAIFKEGNGSDRALLRRRVKRTQRSFLKTNLDKIIEGTKTIPDDKSIINEYDYCDYICDCEYTIKDNDALKEKLSRK